MPLRTLTDTTAFALVVAAEVSFIWAALGEVSQLITKECDRTCRKIMDRAVDLDFLSGHEITRVLFAASSAMASLTFWQ